MARLVSLILLAVIVIFLAITFFQVLAPFLLPLFLAGVLAMLCQPLYQRILAKTKNRPRLAAGLTTTAVMALIFIPAMLGTMFAAAQLFSLARQPELRNKIREAVEVVSDKIDLNQIVIVYRDWTGNEEITAEELKQQVLQGVREMSVTIAQKTWGYAGTALNVLGDALSAVVSLMMFVLALYYFLADGPALLEATVSLVPVQRDYQKQLLTQFYQAVRAVILATLAAAVGQGIATACGALIVGYPQFFFLIAMLGTLTALVPLLGTWLVWLPLSAWLAWEGHWYKATFLFLYGAIFVGTLDNLIRTYVLQSNITLHPLLAFVSVLGGLQAMGLWGVFVGPIVASCLHGLMQIFNRELIAFSQEQQGKSVATPETKPPPTATT